MGLIYSGQPIRTWDGCAGTFRYWLPDGAIAAVLYDYDVEEFGVNLDADEWEPVLNEPALHEEMYKKGLFDE